MKGYKGAIDVNFPDRGADLGFGCRMKYRNDVSRDEYDAFINTLIESGEYTVYQKNTIGDNSYITLTSDNGMLHMYYTAFNRTVRIISDDLSHYVLPVDDSKDYERITDTSLCVMAMNYTHREITDGNGMSYVTILADGRFIIMDGGYVHDAERTYKFLCDNNKRKDGKIVIAAWFMSHSHADHHGCFERFTELYADKVELQYWIANPARYEMYHRGGGYSSFLTTEVQELLKAYDGVKQIKPHSGQIIKFCDAEFEIVYTLEDYLPRTLGNMNDSSTVIRMKVGGQTVLFMGDCERSASELICDIQGEALKSDIVQVNHHGYSGGTSQLYTLVAPKYALWTTSEIAFTFRTCGVKYQWIGNAVNSNKFLFDTVGKENCFVADGQCKIIRLPLTDKEKDITYYSFD